MYPFCLNIIVKRTKINKMFRGAWLPLLWKKINLKLQGSVDKEHEKNLNVINTNY